MKFTKLFLALGVMAAWSISTNAQISVGLSGAPVDNFGTLPGIGSWSTKTLPGAGTAPETIAAMDQFVNGTTNAASTINTVVTSNTGNPPGTLATATWSSAGFYLQTRPTGNAATLLMATLTNNSGSQIYSFTMNYVYQQRLTITGLARETIPGHRVYYSVSGAAGSWIPLGNFGQSNPPSTDQNISIPVDLSGSPWPANTAMFLLFSDDNSNANADWANGLDSFAITSVATTILPTSIAITSPTNNQQVAQYANLTVTTVTTGSITNVDFLVDGLFVTNDTTAPFGGTVPVTLPPGTYRLTARATDATGAQVTSVPITFIVTTNAPPTLALTNSYSGTITGLTFLVGTPINIQASYTDDDTITNIEWRVDGSSYLTNRINNTQIYINPTEGMHTFSGIASDTRGQQTTASLTFTITNPPSPQFTVLQPNGDNWYYYATNTGAEPPPQGGGSLNWFDVEYDASSTFSGPSPAELGNGDIGDGYPEKTVIDIGLGQPRYMTVYFRKYFNVADPSLYPSIALRGLFDDGAVVHLNGVAVWTNNITVTTSPIGFTNAANGAVSETAYQAFNLNNVGLTHLLPGFNSIAVEVHQQNTNSTDLSFDFMIWGEIQTTPTVAISSPANGQAFAQCDPIIISATASSFVTNVDFYVDNVLVGSDGTVPFSFTNVGAASGPHTIKVIARDSFDVTVESDPVSITVVPNAPPVVTFTNSYSGANTGLVFLVGSPITCQFSVSDPDSALASVDFLVNDLVILTTNVAFGTLTVGDALAGNPTFTIRARDNCNGNSSASRTFSITNPPATSIVVSNGSRWKYFNTNASPLADGAGEWYVNGYNDSAWLSGFAEIGGGDAVLPPAVATVPERTLLDLGPTGARFTAAYFRHTFNIADPSAYGALTVWSMHDDGAVVYLNGAIVATFNLPAGPYSYTNLANAAVAGDGVTYFRSNITATLRTGPNTLAVEVHQNSITSSDLSFDLMLHAVAVAGPPLTIVLDSVADTATVSWAASGYVLQQAGSIAMPTSWTDVPGNPGSPVVITQVSTKGIKFFQLRQGP